MRIPNPESSSAPQNTTSESFLAEGGLTALASQWVDYYGGEGNTFTKEEDIELASVIQDGLTAEHRLDNGRDGLSPASRNELEQQIAAGRTAQQALVEVNLRFAYKHAWLSLGSEDKQLLTKLKDIDFKGTLGGIAPGAYRPLSSSKSPYADYADRKSYAVIGLMQAARAFKPSGEAKFTTYAAWWIQTSIDRSSQKEEHNGIRLPIHKHEELYRYFREYQTVPPDHRVPADVARCIRLHDYVSLDHDFTIDETLSSWNPDPDPEDDVPTELHEYIGCVPLYMSPAQELVELDELDAKLRSILMTLTEREASVISMRFGLDDGRPKTLDEIGQIWGLTRERIRQIESKALGRMRLGDRLKALEGYGSWSMGSSEFASRWRGDDLTYADAFAANAIPTYSEQPITPTAHDIPRKRAAEEKPDETWQISKDEAWELPERQEIVETAHPSFDEVKRIFMDNLRGYFASGDSKDNTTGDLESFMQQLSRETADYHLSCTEVQMLWDGCMAEAYDDLKRSSENFKPDDIGRLFSRLLQYALGSDEQITLHIPSNAAAEIGYLASGLEHGTVIIKGQPGDYLASGNSGMVTVAAESAGSFAGAGMRGSSRLLINGTAGEKCGQGASEDCQIVARNARSIDMASIANITLLKR